jgi:hypothetical protein
MWCPEGYYSWSEVLTELRNTSEQIVSLVCLGGTPTEIRDGEPVLTKSAEYYLTASGVAKHYNEATLILDITTAFLMVQFLEAYPPTLACVEGNKVRPDWPLICHRDQLECCVYSWPPNENSQFRAFFDFLECGQFSGRELLNRFSFIDGETGCMRSKNGAASYLVNGLGLDEASAAYAIETATRLKGYIICWDDFPDNQEFRTFMSCIEVDDVFSRALNFVFEEAVPSGSSDEDRRKIGRPRKREDVARCYLSIFGDGHEALGLSWKEAEKAVSEKFGRTVTRATLVRGLRELRQSAEQKEQK